MWAHRVAQHPPVMRYLSVKVKEAAEQAPQWTGRRLGRTARRRLLPREPAVEPGFSRCRIPHKGQRKEGIQVQTIAETRPQAVDTSGGRVVGFDVARAFAILGMVVVHFSLVLADERSGTDWLDVALGFL